MKMARIHGTIAQGTTPMLTDIVLEFEEVTDPRNGLQDSFGSFRCPYTIPLDAGAMLRLRLMDGREGEILIEHMQLRKTDKVMMFHGSSPFVRS